MKLASVLLILIALTFSTASAQEKVTPNKPSTTLNPESGFITINELTAGFGLGITSVPYSKSYFGFTTINGYQIDKNFVMAAGTGILGYNGGVLIPLFLDFRYRFNLDPYTPFIWADGGFLLNLKDFSNGTKQFLNPGAGVRYAFSRNIAANLGAGLLLQSGGGISDTFINFKGGVTYKF
jgi:opacity protein-like surface antigen